MAEQIPKIWKFFGGAAVLLLFVFSLSRIFFPSKGPNGNRLTISTPAGEVVVKNLYEDPADRTDDAVVPVEASGYKIVYFPEDQAFLITLLNKPLKLSQEQAETAFLKQLGINRAEACKLEVAVRVPAFVDENAAGGDYGLSFCPNSKHF